MGIGDNLGSHIATQTIVAPYGISASTFAANSITSSNAITTSSDVVAHAYYGDGSHLTGLAGTGDVVKAATQTFTGANTFTGSVTVSSLTVTAATIRGTWKTVATVTLTAASTTTITGLTSGKHYKFFFSLRQNTSAGDLQLLINSKSGSGYSSASFAHNASNASGSSNDNRYCILQYPTETTAAGRDQMGEYSFYVTPTTNDFNLHGRFMRYVSNDVDGIASCSYYAIGASTFPISIYTSAGTLTGTIYLQEFIP